ncbi:MAG: Mur ligase domain-containing protein, partial [Gemmatimonadota bacterium]|nr:Mur ligase domain-containing protein [Gemmatimonadota bacterium]
MKVSVSAIRKALDEQGLLAGVQGNLPREASGVADDSRAVQRGDLFVAVRGWKSDGHDFLDAAAQRGAAVAIVEDPARTALPSLVVREGRRAAAVAAATVYGNPARNLTILGVTGTNGKTTTTSIIRHLFDDGSSSSASIGTLGVLIGSNGEVLPGGGGLTTPGPVELQRV